MRHLVNGLPYSRPSSIFAVAARTAVDGLRITIDFAVDLDHQIDSAVVKVSTAEQCLVSVIFGHIRGSSLSISTLLR